MGMIKITVGAIPFVDTRVTGEKKSRQAEIIISLLNGFIY
jgi:hypothetical protein